MPITRIGDIDLAYETHGEGPPLLAIMGLTGTRRHWRGFAERFADRHRVIMFDNRGVGETTAPRGAYTAAQMADDALGLLDHLGIDRAAVLGVSMGGMISQELALRAPKRVGKLILGCTHFGGSRALPSAPAAAEAFASLGKDGPEASIRRLLAVNFSKAFFDSRPELIEELVQHGIANRMSPMGFQGQLMAVGMHDTAARVGTIEADTLVITGDDDLLIPVENAKLLASAIPNARLVVLPGVGHMFWIEAADAAEAAIREHLVRR